MWSICKLSELTDSGTKDRLCQQIRDIVQVKSFRCIHFGFVYSLLHNSIAEHKNERLGGVGEEYT